MANLATVNAERALLNTECSRPWYQPHHNSRPTTRNIRQEGWLAGWLAAVEAPGTDINTAPTTLLPTKRNSKLTLSGSV
ncbi:hypothetical protein Pmani_038454 [Petrolisthes manimaculis]|uniref:Uncharacterized protein n=1 Tax=Petrolisthes manimaculis TaxID=1843537 RepID=A0AAE1NEE0_9EUCA|nr:hypothetical protein Pmani_038454 [Petrolisthes manimaculis]